MPVDSAKILIVEDEPQIRKFLRVSLSAQGYRLQEAATGRQGLIDAASQQPDLVVLDLGLPDLDGIEWLAEFRGWSTTPVIVLSARGQEKDKGTGPGCGGRRLPHEALRRQ